MESQVEPIWIEALGLWFPANERRPQKMYDGLQKYLDDMDFMLSLIPEKARRGMTCIQAGGHIGLWPLKLAEHFKRVVTFEPDPLVFPALELNTARQSNISALPYALGTGASRKELSHYSDRTAVSAMTEVYDGGDLHTEVRVIAIDELVGLGRVGAIVLDVESYEPFILRGAHATIVADQPIIMCEMLARAAPAIEKEMAALGYVLKPNTFNPKCRDRVFVHQSRR